MSLDDGNFLEPGSGYDQPPKHFVDITPNDGTDLPQPVRGIYIGTGGNLTVVGIGDADGSTHTFVGLPQGSIFRGIVKRVMASGTTASNLIGLW